MNAFSICERVRHSIEILGHVETLVFTRKFAPFTLCFILPRMTNAKQIVRMPQLTTSSEAVDVWFEEGMILHEDSTDPSQVVRCCIAEFEVGIAHILRTASNPGIFQSKKEPCVPAPVVGGRLNRIGLTSCAVFPAHSHGIASASDVCNGVGRRLAVSCSLVPTKNKIFW